MKKLLKCASIIYTIILFLPKVYAAEIGPIPAIHTDNAPVTKETTHYNDFIYFYEEYNNIKAIREETTTKAGFYKPPIVGYYGPTAEKVQLRRNCNGIDNCMTLEAFYKKIDKLTNPIYNDIKPITIRANNIDNVCNLYFIEDTKISNRDGTKTINSHYYHGCWSNVKDDGSANFDTLKSNSGDSNKPTNYSNAQNINGMICSSVNRNVVLNGPDIETDYVLFIIKREGPTDIESVGNIGLQNNCNGNGVNTVDAFSRISLADKTTVNYGSPVIVTFKYNVDTFNCSPVAAEKTGPCNGQTAISQRCNKKTIIMDEKNRVNISLEQAARVDSYIDQSKTYQGGGLNIGFKLYIDINWNYNSIESRDGKSNDQVKAYINEQIANKIRTNISKIKFDFDIDGMHNDKYLQEIKNMMNDTRKCEFTHNGENAAIVCDITPEETVLNKFIGTINYNASFTGDNSIGNKIYTDINYSNNYNISMRFTGLNVLKDSDDDDWSINIEDPDKENGSCTVKTQSKIYDNVSDGISTKLKPIYRPINIFDPFPNGRKPGENWRVFVNDNPDRLKESYLESNLEYRIELTPNLIKKIKTNVTSPYSDWDSIDEVTKESSFINEYFIKEKDVINRDYSEGDN